MVKCDEESILEPGLIASQHVVMVGTVNYERRSLSPNPEPGEALRLHWPWPELKLQKQWELKFHMH